jgi:hypothetical protein
MANNDLWLLVAIALSPLGRMVLPPGDRIDGTLGKVMTGPPWPATELVAEMEIGNPSLLYRGLQRFAVKLRSVPAVGLTASLDQHLYRVGTQQVNEPRDRDIAVTYRVDGHP